MSYIIVGTVHDYSFACDQADGCTENRTIRARNIDRARAKLEQLGWATHGELNFCPEHAPQPASARMEP